MLVGELEPWQRYPVVSIQGVNAVVVVVVVVGFFEHSKICPV